jgi:hypothetical protein
MPSQITFHSSGNSFYPRTGLDWMFPFICCSNLTKIENSCDSYIIIVTEEGSALGQEMHL